MGAFLGQTTSQGSFKVWKIVFVLPTCICPYHIELVFLKQHSSVRDFGCLLGAWHGFKKKLAMCMPWKSCRMHPGCEVSLSSSLFVALHSK